MMLEVCFELLAALGFEQLGFCFFSVRGGATYKVYDIYIYEHQKRSEAGENTRLFLSAATFTNLQGSWCGRKPRLGCAEVVLHRD